MIQKQKGTLVDFTLLKVPSNNNKDEVNFTTRATSKDWFYNNKESYNNKDNPEIFLTIYKNDNHKMIKFLLNLPSYQYNDNPLIMIKIANHQQIDQYLMQNAQLNPVHFPVKIINNVMVVYYCKQITITDNQWRIAIPPLMIDDVIRWYHLVLGLPGSQ